MQKVLIIEDDHFSARRLKRLIMDIDDTIDVHGPLKSVAEVAEELAANNDYDLIFSDIRLADGDVFEAFRKVMPQSFVVFTTAYDEYAMEAIKNNGLDYLMKPIDADELRAAIGKLRLNRNAQQSAVVSPLHGVLNDTRQYRERLPNHERRRALHALRRRHKLHQYARQPNHGVYCRRHILSAAHEHERPGAGFRPCPFLPSQSTVYRQH